jgi:hypothetical protein
MDPLVITTLFHYFAILPLLYSDFTEYKICIFASTTSSVLWHMNNEKMDSTFYIDYLAGANWAFHDLTFALQKRNIQIVLVNILIFILNMNILKADENYVISRSIWHILSAMKCFYVSGLIAK